MDIWKETRTQEKLDRLDSERQQALDKGWRVPNEIPNWMSEVKAIVKEKRSSRDLFMYRLYVPVWNREVFYRTSDDIIPIGALVSLRYPKSQKDADLFTYKTSMVWWWPVHYPPKLNRREGTT